MGPNWMQRSRSGSYTLGRRSNHSPNPNQPMSAESGSHISQGDRRNQRLSVAGEEVFTLSRTAHLLSAVPLVVCPCLVALQRAGSFLIRQASQVNTHYLIQSEVCVHCTQRSLRRLTRANIRALDRVLTQFASDQHRTNSAIPSI